MKYVFVALSALVALVAADPPKFLNSKFDVTEGQPFTLKFSGCDSGCTIVIQKGVSNNLKAVQTLTATATGSSFTFTPQDLASDTYNFRITDNASEQSNYSIQFSYQGSGSTSAATAPVSTTASASATATLVSTGTTSSAAATTTTANSSMTTVTSTGKTSSTGSTTTGASTTAASTTTSSSQAASSTQAAVTTKIAGSGAGRLSSPLALVAGAVAAMAYLS